MAKSTNGLGYGTRSGDKDPVVNSGQRKTVGTSIYAMPVDAPSGSDFISGMLEAKEGWAKSDAPVGVKEPGGKGAKKFTASSSAGARYSISPNMYARGGFVENASTQANGRIVKATMGSRQNFGSASAYGSMNG